MTEKEKEIAEKYLLPERPFLYGMASAFDLFGVLGQARRAQLLANLQAESQRPNHDIMRRARRDVGKALFQAMEQHDKVTGEGSR